MSSKQRIGFIESLLSLGNYARQGVEWVWGPALVVGGPLFLAWEAVSAAASTHGWWIYPFVVLTALSAVFGLWMLLLHLNGRVRLLTPANVRIDEEQQAVRRIADQALALAAELNELIGEYQSRPPTIYDHRTDPEAWQRDNWKISSAMLQKFMTKYAAKAQSILMMAKRYGVVSERDVQWMFLTMHSHSIGEIRNLLVRTALDLQDRLQVPVEHILPHIPTFDEQRRLPLEDKRD